MALLVSETNLYKVSQMAVQKHDEPEKGRADRKGLKFFLQLGSTSGIGGWITKLTMQICVFLMCYGNHIDNGFMRYGACTENSKLTFFQQLKNQPDMRSGVEEKGQAPAEFEVLNKSSMDGQSMGEEAALSFSSLLKNLKEEDLVKMLSGLLRGAGDLFEQSKGSLASSVDLGGQSVMDMLKHAGLSAKTMSMAFQGGLGTQNALDQKAFPAMQLSPLALPAGGGLKDSLSEVSDSTAISENQANSLLQMLNNPSMNQLISAFDWKTSGLQNLVAPEFTSKMLEALGSSNIVSSVMASLSSPMSTLFLDGKTVPNWQKVVQMQADKGQIDFSDPAVQDILQKVALMVASSMKKYRGVVGPEKARDLIQNALQKFSDAGRLLTEPSTDDSVDVDKRGVQEETEMKLRFETEEKALSALLEELKSIPNTEWTKPGDDFANRLREVGVHPEEIGDLIKLALTTQEETRAARQ